MSFYLDYTDEFNRANLILAGRLMALPAEKMREAWQSFFEHKRFVPNEFVVFLDWMPAYLSETRIKKYIKAVIYEEMQKASSHLEEAWQEVEADSLSTDQFFALKTSEGIMPTHSTHPFTRGDFGWNEVTKLGEAIGLLQNGSYALSEKKKSAFTGMIECLVEAKLIKNLPLYTLHSLFGRHYQIRIKTDRTTFTRTDFFDEAKRKLPKLFPYLN